MKNGMRVMGRVGVLWGVVGLLGSVPLVMGQATQGGGSGTDEAAVRGALADFKKAVEAGDVGKIALHLSAGTPEAAKQRAEVLAESARMSRELPEAVARVNVAATEKFKEPLLPEAANIPTGKPAEPEVKVKGNRAELTWNFAGPGGKPVVYKREWVLVDGVWKQPVEDLGAERSIAAVRPMNEAMIRSCNAVAEEIRAGKYATIEEARQGQRDRFAREEAAVKKGAGESGAVAASTGSRVWDLSKSQKLKDIGWPKEETGWNWIPDGEQARGFTVTLPGRDPVTFVASSFDAGRDVESGKELPTDHVDGEEQLGHVDFVLRDAMTAEQVKTFVAQLERGEAVKAQLAAWPPAGDLENQLFDFREALGGGGEVSISVVNNRKNTGEKDSWMVSLTWRARAIR